LPEFASLYNRIPEGNRGGTSVNSSIRATTIIKELEDLRMDMGTKLEHTLRHLKNAEPRIEHWMEFGDVGRSTEVHGILLNSGALNKDMRHMVNGLVVAVHLLAKTCDALQRRIAELEDARRLAG
jgi:hypothetical protein